MTLHLQRDLDHLKKGLLGLSGLVEEAIGTAIRALVDRRAELAEEVIAGDQEIDRLEVELEEDCLKILALHQPVAGDLRFLVAALKVNNDLERMGDLAANIAKRALYLAKHETLPVPFDFAGMADDVHEMVQDSLHALINQDTSLAVKVLKKDDDIDDAHGQMYKVLRKTMKDDRAIKRASHYLSASRHLERIADLTTNIAEDVIFMVTGKVVRHRFEEAEGDDE